MPISFPSIQRARRRKAKVFCIGLGKTGTTSLEKALVGLGFRAGNQRAGERLVDDWGRRDFRRIAALCETADAFQDVPFSLPYTFAVLDQLFPNARFILTSRDSAEQWYQSLTQFHSQLWADGERIPTVEDLQQAVYLEPGYVWRSWQLVYDTPADDPYNREYMLAFYERHLANVREYFRTTPGKLLEVNVANPADYRRLCEFLGKEPAADGFPWLNKTNTHSGT